jgi:hypothetical protein
MRREGTRVFRTVATFTRASSFETIVAGLQVHELAKLVSSSPTAVAAAVCGLDGRG